MEEEVTEIPVTINNDLERRIADAFEIYDHSGNRTIDVREVGTIVRGLGCCPTEAEVQEITLKVEDPKVHGIVHLAYFMPHMSQMITEHKYEPASPGKLLDAFHILDPERLGYLTKEQISTLLTEYGEPFTQEELDAMMEGALDPYKQTINYEYFINKLMHCPSDDRNNYTLADAIEAAKPPPPPPPKRFSEQMRELQQL